MTLTRWVCPYCEHASIITRDANIRAGRIASGMDSTDSPLVLEAEYIACPNPACKRTTLSIWYGSGRIVANAYVEWYGKESSRRLLPPSYARAIPDYVPAPIREDYQEACAIADLSPKAAATLARRALQGIVRDFHGVAKGTLNQELEAIKTVVDPLVWRAIDAVRSIGNIGAHMEKDINVIIDVEADEAVRLLRLIEMLVREWYVARFNREQELAAIISIGAEKQEQRKTGGAAAADLASQGPGDLAGTGDGAPAA